MFFKWMIIVCVVTVAIIGSTLAPSIGVQAASTGGESAGESPAVFFSEKEFEFEPVVDGVKVVHEFPVTNKGTATLFIQNVLTG